MGRKRGTGIGGAVNPLQRMFGAYLRVERIRLGFSSAEVARGLGLTDTYFRLIESGRATLSQSLVFEVIATFSDGRQRPISFSQLCIYLVGLSWVSAEIASSEEGATAAQRILAALSERVVEFERLLQRTKRYFDFEEGSLEQRHYLEEVAVPELSEFLVSESYGAASNRYPLQSLDNIPTLNIEIIMDVNASLSWRPFVHTRELAAKWEGRKAKEFRELRAIYRDPKTIISGGNISQFQFPYLSDQQFLSFRAVFSDSVKSTDVRMAEMEAQRWKDEFVKRISESRKQQGGVDLTPDDIKKVQFVCLTSIERVTLDTAISTEILGSGPDSADAYWSFQTVRNFPIAFLGLVQGREDSTRNLTLQDANNKELSFDTLWNSIHDTRKHKTEHSKVYQRHTAK